MPEEEVKYFVCIQWLICDFQRVGFNIEHAFRCTGGGCKESGIKALPHSLHVLKSPELPPPVNEFSHINTRKLTLIYKDGDS